MKYKDKKANICIFKTNSGYKNTAAKTYLSLSKLIRNSMDSMIIRGSLNDKEE